MASQNAQKYMTKAAQFVTMSNELTTKAHRVRHHHSEAYC
jgi:hypothetical protein